MLNLDRQTLLIIAPHPDDEVLGCGGLIKHVKEGGGSVHVLFMTVGHTKDYSAQGKSTANQRIKEIKQVAKSLMFDSYNIALKGNRYHLQLDQVSQLTLIGHIEKYIQATKPTILASVHHQDYNQDHRATASAVLAATRPAPLSDRIIPDVILGYRSVMTSGWAEPQLQNPQFHLELRAEDIVAKSNAMNLYSSQVRSKGHQRTAEGIEKVARFSGLFAGTTFAESYTVYRLFNGVAKG
ncbi:MAG TPA: PIG-L family deacetylase [Candidatus Saccharimonadales bacterium]|nr:PIG-L family deacetylase [Candidatus Saccharimonadales bacterium]